MIDRNFILQDFEDTARRLGRKGVDRESLEKLRDQMEQRRSLVVETDSLRAEMNKKSKEIGLLYQQGQSESATSAKETVAKIKKRLPQLEKELKDVENDIEDRLLRIPNFPADDCPDGAGEEDNVVLRYESYDQTAFAGKSWRPHWEIGESLGIFDANRAAKLSGSMFSLLRGDGARLLRALVNFGLDLNRETYEEIAPPHFVRSVTLQGTGHLPKFAHDAYALREDDLWAIPTGEVPLTGLHRDEILSANELPKRYMAYTVCFRREAGSAGKDTRGMQRLHEFHKVELVRLCTPENVQSEFEGLLSDAERALNLLELPYRVVDLCTADLTFSSTRIYDLEVYSPGVDRWLEVSSVGIFGDFQTRRSQVRFRRDQDSRPEIVHALNGSAMATPRVWAALIEHGQQPDGTVKLPKVLHDYFGGSVIGAKK